MSIPKQMKAAVLYGPNDLRVQDYPVPTPGPDEVLLKVRACAICGTDPKIIGSGWNLELDYGDFIPGHEYSGEVAAVGPGVTGYQVGDRVAIETHKGCGKCLNCIRGRYTICLNYGKTETGHRHYGFTVNGGYAQYAVNHINTLYHIPDNVSFSEAALVTTGGCVMNALENVGGFMAGETVAVFGPGPIGLVAVALCKALGATRIFLVGTREERLKVGEIMGADVVLNINLVEDAVKEIREITGGLGVDLAIESSGSAQAAADCIEVVRRGGRISFIGDPGSQATLNLKRFVLDDLKATAVRGEGGANCGRMLQLVSVGAVDVKPLITHHFPLDQINAAFDTFVERKDNAMKVVVQPWEE